MNYCITFINAFKRSFSLSNDDAIKTNYCITISKQFEHVSNMTGPSPGLGWGKTCIEFTSLGLSWASAGLGPGQR